MRNGEQRAARGLTGYQFWNVRPLCLAALGFCLGICLCFYVRISAWGWLMAGCAALFLCMLWLLYTGRRGFFVCLVLITAGLGMLRTIPALRGVPLVWPKEGKIEGVICDFQQSDGVFTLLLKDVEKRPADGRMFAGADKIRQHATSPPGRWVLRHGVFHLDGGKQIRLG